MFTCLLFLMLLFPLNCYSESLGDRFTELPGLLKTTLDLVMATSVSPPKDLKTALHEFEKLKTDIQVTEKPQVYLVDILNLTEKQLFIKPRSRLFALKYPLTGKETLKEIAQKFYFKSDYWTKIYWANKELFSKIRIAKKKQDIIIPALEINHQFLSFEYKKQKEYTENILLLNFQPLLYLKDYFVRPFSAFRYQGILFENQQEYFDYIAYIIQYLLVNFNFQDKLLLFQRSKIEFELKYNNKGLLLLNTDKLGIYDDLAENMLNFIQNLQRYLNTDVQKSL